MADFFRRVEKKYILTEEQYLKIKPIIEECLIQDEYGESLICNIYFDTKNYDLIRHSITKPVFKDKIRLRSYNVPSMDSDVFLEIKRKFDGVVGKRRIGMKLSDYYKYINKEINLLDTQIKSEIDYYFDFYDLEPKMFLSYYRCAYYDKNNRDFRITFDKDVIARNYDLELEKGSYGINILDKNKYIMEIKTLGAIPLWLVKLLNELQVYPCGFSKYGEAYSQIILNISKEKSII